MKRACMCLLIVCMLLSLSACGMMSTEQRKETAKRIVEDNLELLKREIDGGDFSGSASIEGIRDVQVRWQYIPARKASFVEYACGGAGFGPSTAYWGFYYSAQDSLTEIWCAGEPLTPSGSGFLYEQPDGDNRYYTEHIADHFYYYEAAF